MSRRNFNATRSSVLAISPDLARPKAEADGGQEYEIEGGVAVIEICGIIMQQDTWMNRLIAEYFGGAITEVIGQQFQNALDNDAVKAILFKVNSPGGDAWGLDELSEKVFKARGKKPIVAHAQNMNCSAAYYISSAADSVYSTKDTMTGCIGSMMSWLNYDGMMEQLGIKEILLVSECSPDKVPDETTPEGLALYQQEVNDLGWLFVDAVARNRGVSREDVISKYGAGWVKTGKDAQKAGMIDGVMSYEKVLMSLQAGKLPNKNSSLKGKNMTLAQLLTSPISAILGGNQEGDELTEGEPATLPVRAQQGQVALPPEVQAQLDELATLKSQQASAAAASYQSRFDVFKDAAKTRIEPAKLKSDQNPDGIDLEATFKKFDAAGLGGDFTAAFGASKPHAIFETVPTPKTEFEKPGSNEPDAQNQAELAAKRIVSGEHGAPDKSLYSNLPTAI